MKKALVPFIVILCALAVRAQDRKGAAPLDDELQRHLERRGKAFLEHYVAAAGGRADPGPWKVPLERVIIRLASAAGKSPYGLTCVVVKNPTFNALALPGGQVVVHSGLLDDLEARAKKKMAADGEEGKKRGLDHYRENLAAPIMAHELAHYFNRHAFNSVKKAWSLRDRGDDAGSLELFRYGRDLERDADMTGAIMIAKAGYDPGGMVELLSMLNDLEQALRKENKSVPFYFSSHPSPHARLAALPHGGQDLHRWAERLEWAFDSIQMGKNLDKARAVIAEALAQSPGNYFLRKADAVALHKSWLATVPLKKQALKSVVSLPAYRDEMTAPRTKRTRGTATAGSKPLFDAALKAYRALEGMEDDPEALSDYAALLAYSDDPAEKARACALAQKAAAALPAPWIYSNLALTLHLAGKPGEALAVLAPVASQIDEDLRARLSAAAFDRAQSLELARMKDYLEKCRLIDREYVHADYTPLLNMALVLSSMGDAKQASVLATAYLERYDSASAWATHLSRETGVRLKAAEKDDTVYTVDGVRAGDSMEVVIRKWGRAARVTEIEGSEQWSYARGIVLIMEDGTVQQMALTSGPLLVNGSFGVGTGRAALEKAAGKSVRRSGDYHVYGKGGRLYVMFINDRAERIVLVP